MRFIPIPIPRRKGLSCGLGAVTQDLSPAVSKRTARASRNGHYSERRNHYETSRNHAKRTASRLGSTGIHRCLSLLTTGPEEPPQSGIVSVAYPLSKGVIDMDFTGPWGVFGSVMLPGDDMVMPFHQYSVAETKTPLITASGLTVVPDYTFETAPQPQLIVIAARQVPSKTMVRWIRQSSPGADLTMSVCLGAFVLAKTGLLDGKAAAAHHDAYQRFASDFPKIHVIRGVRFVDDGRLATSGGLAAGIDLAMHVIDRYFGMKVAESAAYNLEYQGQGWKNPNSSSTYSRPPAA